jgi:hypothetical protein
VPRWCPVLRISVPALLAALLLAGLSACAGAGDPTSPTPVTAQGTYFHATITLQDVAPACVAGVSCAPEFYSCDGTQGITVPRSWTMSADQVAAGAIAYNASSQFNDANATLTVRGTDVSGNTSVSVQFFVLIDRTTSVISTQIISPATEATYANVDTRCTHVNAVLDPVSLFGLVAASPSSLAITSLSMTGPDIDFAQPDNGGLTARYIEGTFSFTGQNRQELGQIYIAQVRVDGCFRVQLPSSLQGVAIDPSANPPCP